MLSLDTLKARIQAEVPGIRLVDAYASLVAAKGVARQTPAAFIYPASETAPLGNGYQHLQRVRVQFGVLIVVRNVSDAGGAAAQKETEQLSAALRAALCGWVPGSDYDKVQLTSAGPAELDNGFLYWPETFVTTQEFSNP
jgi:hypothetical protein